MSAGRSSVSEFLLEIGCEEIPAAWFIPPVDLRQGLASGFISLARQERIEKESPTVFSTPRRLGLHAEVLSRQEDRSSTVWGPSLLAARDKEGGWSKAALGFASKVGVPPEQLREGPKDLSKPAERYLSFEKREQGRSAAELLPGLVAALLRRLAFPKRMSWDAWLEDGKGAFPFGRPIRWILALLDGEVIPFEIYALSSGSRGERILKSGALTIGHRFLPRGQGGSPFPVRSFRELQSSLRANFVMIDPAERDQRVAEGLKAQAGPDWGGDDHGLVAEWRELVEYPTVVAGHIPAEFRALPIEVLETVLVHHQKYIPLSQNGRVSRFAAVINAEPSAATDIVRGMERVVVARLRDAAFFFEEDMKRPLSERVADLEGVTFHQGLGTYKDKTERIEALVDAMGAQMGILTKPEHEAAREAARLAKADLTTLMVREFPELQGIMGGVYLKAQGNPWENIINAVRWHYHPLSIVEGSPPAGLLAGSDATVFGAVSLADKLDTVAGYFGLGMSPTGSSDPYGLRRAAQGAITVLLDFWNADAEERRPNLKRLIGVALSAYSFPKDEVTGSLDAFFLDRLEYVLSARGFPAGEVAAVLHTRDVPALENPHDCLVRLKALHRVRAEAPEDFEHLAVAFKRAKNILADELPSKVIEPELFELDAERNLYAAVLRLSGLSGGWEARLRSLAALRGPVDRFFDDVLVMAEDPRIRANRLGLLSKTLSLFYQIADISKLGG
jgi:glycyl-tRNA synthetase beta chain